MRDLCQKHFFLIQLRVDLHLSADILHQALGVIGIIDVEAVLISDPVNIPPENSHAGGVKGCDMYCLRKVFDHAFHTFFHLPGSLIGKCDRENAPRSNSFLFNQPRNPACKNSGFSRSRSGQNQEGAIQMSCSLLLLRIQIDPCLFLIHFVLLLHSSKAATTVNPLSSVRTSSTTPSKTFRRSRTE